MRPQPLGGPLISPDTSPSMVTRKQARGPAVDDGGPVAVVVTRKDLDGHDQPDDAKDDVDEEDRAPGQTEHVGADEETGQDRAADTGETENRSEQPERLGEH